MPEVLGARNVREKKPPGIWCALYLIINDKKQITIVMIYFISLELCYQLLLIQHDVVCDYHLVNFVDNLAFQLPTLK